MSLDKLIDEASQEAQRPQAYEAVVSRDVGAATERIWVTIPSFADELEYGPLPWMPRYTLGAATVEVDLPAKGDRALVVVSDDEPEPEAWVIGLWPASYD